MKNNIPKNVAAITICLALAMFIVCSMTNTVKAAEPSEPHPANAMWTEPSTETIDNTTVNLGYMFNVTVWVNVSDPAFTWQVTLLFNNTYFNATRAGYTAGFTSDFFAGHSVIPVPLNIDNQAGFVLYGESLLGDDSETGYGSLAWFEFNLTKIPPQNHLRLNLSNADTFVLGTDLEDLTLDIVNGTDIPVIPEFPHVIMLLIATVCSTMPAILTKKFRG